MKFLSIKEFFYKLNTIGFILLLLPLSVFIFLYYRTGNVGPLITDEVAVNGLAAGTLIVFLLALTTVHWVRQIRVKKLKSLLEISRKMDGYARFILLRMTWHAICALLTAAGFFLTSSLLFAGLFIFMLVITFLQWPSRTSFCRLLDVNANERTMIMTNGDTITMRGTRKEYRILDSGFW